MNQKKLGQYHILYWARVSYETCHIYGGGAVVAWDTVRLLKEIGYTVHVAYFDGEVNQSRIRVDKAKGKTSTYEHWEALLRAELYDLFWANETVPVKTYREIVQRKIKIVHEMHSPDFYPVKWRHRFEIKPYIKHWRKFIWERDHRRACNYANKIIVPSNYARKTISENYSVDIGRVEAVYNSVKTDLFQPSKNRKSRRDSVTLINAGRMAPNRNFVLCIKAYHKLSERYDHIKLRLAGDGYEMALCKDYVRKHDVPGVTFLGAIDREYIANEYQQADILLNTSEAESFGCVVAEAMSTGLPVVGFKAGALPELVKNGQNGFLGPVCDIDSMVEKASLLIADDKLRRAFGECSRQRVEKMFSENVRKPHLAQVLDNFFHGGKASSVYFSDIKCKFGLTLHHRRLLNTALFNTCYSIIRQASRLGWLRKRFRLAKGVKPLPSEGRKIVARGEVPSIPNHYRQAFQLSRKQEAKEGRLVFSQVLYNVELRGKGLVLCVDEYLASESIELDETNNILMTSNCIRPLESAEPLQLVGKHASLADHWTHWKGYYHWLLGILPKLQLIDDDRKIIIKAPVSAYERATLELLGVWHRCEAVEVDFLTVENFQYVSYLGPARVGDIDQEAILYVRNGILDNFEKKIGWSGGDHKKVYITRGGYGRGATNEDKLLAYLKEHDWTILDTGNSSFLDQVDILYNARLVMGIHGANLTNILWCKNADQIIVIELLPRRRVVPTNEDIALALGMQYNAVICADKPNGELILDTSLIKNLLKNLSC